MDLLAGRYRVLARLGRGGAGEVYLVRDEREGGEKLALKRLRPPPAHEGDPFAAFAREFLALASLSHPNLVAVRDFGRTGDGGAYFTYEPARGREIDRWARGRSWRAIAEAIHQLLWALEFLHNRGILHLDVKPGNVIVSGGARPVLKLIDLGVFRRPGRPAGDLEGTLPYMAPEMLRGGALDRRTDLYAAGVTLHRVLYGQVPFAGATVEALLAAQARGRPEVAATGGIPDTLEQLGARLLEPDPRARYASAAEAARALEPMLGPGAYRAGRALEIDGAIRSLPFVGRDRERALLPGALEALRAGRAAATLFLVTGPEGIGKTRLLREWGRMVQVAGGEVIDLQVSAPDGRPPILSLLRRIRDMGAGEPALARALEGCAPPRRPADPQDPLWRNALSRERTALAGGLARAILALAGVRPVLLAIDGGDRADAAIWDLAASLARAAAARTGSPPAAAACAVALGADRPATVADRVARLAREPFARRVRLRPLTLRAAGRLAGAVLRAGRRGRGRPVSAGPIERRRIASLRARSGGNPFFLQELLRRELAGDGREGPAQGPGLPASVEAALERRIRGLAREDLLLAARACLVPGSRPIDSWPAAWRGSVRRARARIEGLIHRGILARERREGRTVLAPAHPTLRALILARVPAGEAARLRLEAARGLETQGAPAEDVAVLYLEAGDRERGIPCGREAAEALWAHRVIEPLPRLYRLMLGRLRPGDVDPAREIRSSLADALDLLGDFDGALASLRGILRGGDRRDPAARARVPWRGSTRRRGSCAGAEARPPRRSGSCWSAGGCCSCAGRARRRSTPHVVPSRSCRRSARMAARAPIASRPPCASGSARSPRPDRTTTRRSSSTAAASISIAGIRRRSGRRASR